MLQADGFFFHRLAQTEIGKVSRLPEKKIEINCNFFFGLESDGVIMNDAELVQQIKAGNDNAFRYLVVNHQRLVLHIVGRIVKQQQDVEDICQEVFMKVYRKIKKFRGESRLSTWIASIAFNTSITHLRSKNRKQEVLVDENVQPEWANTDDWLVQRKVEKEEAKIILLQLIEKLPVQYRTVLTLFHLEEFSYKEVEEITGMPEGTIKSYLSRARKLLKDKMEKMIELEKTNIFADYAERR